MRLIRLSDDTIINLAQVQYCKIYRTPIEGQLVPQALLQIFFNGADAKNPVSFEGEQAERLWQALEYQAVSATTSEVVAEYAD